MPFTPRYFKTDSFYKKSHGFCLKNFFYYKIEVPITSFSKENYSHVHKR